MGCLKLEHSAYLPVLKVAKGFFLSEEKTGASSYRYGFNGMEKDNEVKGSGNSYDFGARIQDPRLGRWLSPDPYYKLLPSESPYNFAINSPIKFFDPDGNIISAGNDESWAYLYNAIIETFSSNEVLQELFIQEAGTLNFDCIDEAKFNEVINQVDDPKLKALANGYYEMINAAENYTFMAYHDSYINDEIGFENLNLSESDVDKLNKLGGIFDDNNKSTGFIKPAGDGNFVLFMNMDKRNKKIEEGEFNLALNPRFLLGDELSVPYSLTSDINGYMLSLFIMEDDGMKSGGLGKEPQNRGGIESWDGGSQTALLYVQIYNLTQSTLGSQLVNLGQTTGVSESKMDKTPSELSPKKEETKSSSGKVNSILPPFD